MADPAARTGGSAPPPNGPLALAPDFAHGLQPAFRDRRDGETHLAREPSGALADSHRFAHLPAHWVIERDAAGESVALHPAVVAGYWRAGGFVALAELLAGPGDG